LNKNGRIRMPFGQQERGRPFNPNGIEEGSYPNQLLTEMDVLRRVQE